MTMSSSDNPAVMAQPGSGYRFQPRHDFANDQSTIEIRLVIMGWLKQAQDIAASGAGMQELRDAVFRAAELVVALSASEIAKTLERKKSIRKQTFKQNGVAHATSRGKAGRSKTSEGHQVS